MKIRRVIVCVWPTVWHLVPFYFPMDANRRSWWWLCFELRVERW